MGIDFILSIGAVVLIGFCVLRMMAAFYEKKVRYAKYVACRSNLMDMFDFTKQLVDEVCKSENLTAEQKEEFSRCQWKLYNAKVKEMEAAMLQEVG